ncbi:TonB-dependent receptor [Pedobacter chinensis]|uniref:TonB-dependent receptor n=1 Tax=Pedobacter chinensis TaxID=2282421 RepID=A0A369Q1H1_9SPHI|nr:TonB-dependent receptor [Pedobacter chinensis]RDC58352.1 TonB-dependent receptor [Pedobacter chinensis]
MRKILIVIYILTCVSCGLVMAQTKTITGIVRDNGGPLPGTGIVEKGLPNNGTVVDGEGKFKLTLKGTTQTIIVKSIGYLTQEVNVSGKNTVEITLAADTKGLEEVVVVGYGVQKKITNTGAVSSISAAEVRQNPTASVQNTLAGRLPGFTSQQRSGQPGKDGADFFIRGVSSYVSGQRPLIIVDDIEYNYADVAQLDPNEIETISILKDASTTAIYGIKGANGVLVITTKRGRAGKPGINFKSELGISEMTFKPNFLDSYQAALLTNQGYVNSGQAPFYTEQDIELFKNGTDPYGHPNVNWFDEIFNPTSQQSRTNLDISGGTESVKYFVSLGYLWQNGLMKDFSSASDVNNNYYYKRYNFRSNLDIQATKTLSFRLDMTGRFGETNDPITYSPEGEGLIREVYSYNFLPPFAYAIYNPDGSYGYNPKLNTTNVIGRLATQGYNRSFDNDLNITFGGTQLLDFITKGLSAKALIAYSSAQTNSRGLVRSGTVNSFPQYSYNITTGAYIPKDPNLYRIPPFNLTSSSGNAQRTTNVQASLNYRRSFANHNTYGLVLLNQNSYVDGPVVPVNYRGLTFRAGYDYKQKYLIEFNAGYNGTDKFAKQNRYGWFPAVSIGWNLAEEKIFKKALPFIDLFKLRGSYGLVGSDFTGSSFAYAYDQIYSSSATSYNFGPVPTNALGITEGTLGNNSITWEKEKKLDVGVDVNVFKGKIALTVDYFNNDRYDILTRRESVPAFIGVGLPPVNLGKVNNKGWDGEITFKDRINDFDYFIRGTFSFAENKVVFRDEAQQRYPWLQATGNPVGQNFGYIFDGFYSEADLTNPEVAKPTTAFRSGDLKYKDLNGDKIIDAFDKAAIGKPNLPSTTLGVTLGFNYKGFNFSALFTSSSGYSLALASEAISAFSSNFQPIHLQAWTPELGNDAKFPIISRTVSAISAANVSQSDFWQVNAKYLRLKTMEIGYQLPARWVKPIGMNAIRIYANGYNLLTWTNIDKFYQADPEANTGGKISAYPNQRIYNFGLSFSL